MSRPWDKPLDQAVLAARSSSKGKAAVGGGADIDAGAGSKRRRGPADVYVKQDNNDNDERFLRTDYHDDNIKKQAESDDEGNKGEDIGEAPYVTVDGIRYYSDRFYLCLPSGLTQMEHGGSATAASSASASTTSPVGSASASSSPSSQNKCTCGHTNPPPLLDRSRLVHSLARGLDGGGGLVGAILATYTFDPYWMAHELPDLFPMADSGDNDDGEEEKKEETNKHIDRVADIPTLVLHGHKGLRLYQRSSSSSSNDGKSTSEVGPMTVAASTKREVMNSECNNVNEKSEMEVYDDSDTDEEDDDNANIDVKEEPQEDVPPEEGWRLNHSSDDEGDTTDEEGEVKSSGTSVKRKRRPFFDDSVHVTQILATWVPPRKVGGDIRGRNSSSNINNAMTRVSSSGAGSASNPVTLDDSSDEEDQKVKKINEVIVIDSSDEEEDNGKDGGEIKIKVNQQEDDRVNDANATKLRTIEPSLCVSPGIIKRREGRVGVHHPKYMLLFEKCGSVVVVVTTTNLTRMGACEGMWLQRFEPCDVSSLHQVKMESSSSRISSPRNGDGGSSDFGRVLADYLQRQTDASEPYRLTPDGFFRKYLGFHGGLVDLTKRYCFEKAEVHLIPTVPGDFGGRHSSKAISKAARRQGSSFDRPMLYGPQRVSDILAKIRRKDTKRRKSGLAPSFIATDSDHLIMQATSFGGYWNRENMEAVVRSYMGLDCKSKKTSFSSTIKDETQRVDEEGDEDAADFHDILDSLNIYWPSRKYFESIEQQRTKKRRLNTEDEDEENDYAKHDPMRGFYCFHSTQNFNTNDLSIISRMVQYKTPSVPQIPLILCPHIKTVARLLGDYYENDSRFEHSFSWFMLTSACLSRGAQGRIPDMRGFEGDADSMSYSNFELGVMFCSRTGSAPGTNRLYGFKPKSCGCSNDDKSGKDSKLVHLPVPYKLRAEAYAVDEDDVTMSETPFFHELSDGVGGGGHMSLTPLGRELNAKACK